MNCCRLILFTIIYLVVTSAVAVERPPTKHVAQSVPMELKSFGQEVADYISAGDKDYLSRHVATHKVARRLLSLFEEESGLNLELVEKFIEQVGVEKFEAQFAAQLNAQLPEHFSFSAHWQPVSYRMMGDRAFVLYLVSEEDSFDYIELELSGGRPSWEIVDWYSYYADVWATEVMREMTLMTTSWAADRDSDLGILTRDFLAFQQGTLEARRFFQTLSSLPASVHQNKALMAGILGHAELIAYDEANEFSRTLLDTEYSSDEFLFKRLNLSYLFDDHKTTVEAAAALVERLGGDVYMNVIFFEALAWAGDTKLLNKSVKAAIEESPGSEFLFSSLIYIFTLTEQFQEALWVMDILQDEFDYEFSAEALASDSDYQPLVESELFQRWIEQQNIM